MSKLIKNLRLVAKRKYSQEVGHYHGHHKTPVEIAIEQRATMNHLPQPKGPWNELNAKRLQSANISLYAGVAVLLLSVIMSKSLWEDTLFRPPYEKIRKDFPGAKFNDA